MTHITYKANGDKAKITAEGHAGYNPGNDVVCAGLSAITYQMLNTIDRMVKRNVLSDASIYTDDGRAEASFTIKDRDTWRIAWEVIRIGYECIEEAFPEHVKTEFM